MLLNQSNILLFEFAGKGGIFVGVAARVIELGLAAGGAAVQGVRVHDHVVGAALEAETLLILVWLRRLGCLSMVLLELLTPRSDELVVVLRINDYLVRVVAIVPAIENLILILNLVVVGELRRVVDAYLATALARVLQSAVGVVGARSVP